MAPVNETLETEAITAQFLRRILDDRIEGQLRPLADYLAQWPGREDCLRRAFAELELESPPDADQDALTIGPYRLLKKLGAGGQGEVHLAQDLRLGRQVAIKLLRNFSGGHEDRERFRREAQYLAPLNHPAICPVLDVGVHGEAPYLVMRFVEGQSLESILSDAQAPPTADEIRGVLHLVLELTRGLSAAHAAGVVHRDLKPANIMVETRSDGREPSWPLLADDHPVLLDFGLAGHLATNDHRLTEAGDRFGTPLYMAPEQIEATGAGPDPRVDVYALGVILYRLVTLEFPFEAPTQAGLYRAILAMPPGDPAIRNPLVSRDLSTVILTALEKETPRRYASAHALGADLEALIENRPVSVRRPRSWERMWRWSRRHPARASVVLLGILVATLVLVLGSKWQDLREARQRTAAEALENRLTDAFLLLDDPPTPDAPIKAFLEIAEDHPDLPDALVGLALAHLRAKAPREALAALERSPLRNLPETLRLAAYLAPFANPESVRVSPAEPEGEPTALAAYVDALLLGFRGEHNDAKAPIKALARAQDAVLLAQSPRQIYHRELALAAGRAKLSGIAKSAAAALTARWPDSFAAHLTAGQAIADFDVHLALRSFERAIALRPESYIAHSDFARVLLGLGRYEDAASAARSASSIDPSQLTPYETLITALSALDRDEEALAILRTVSLHNSNHAFWNYFAGHHLAKQGLANESLPFLRKCVDLVPTYAEAWGVLSGVHIMLRDAEAAEEAATRALALSPDNTDALGNLGLSHFLRGDFAQATPPLEEAIRIAPNYHEHYVNLIHCLRGQKRWAEAAARAETLRGVALQDLGTEGDAPELVAELNTNARLAQVLRDQLGRLRTEIDLLSEWERTGFATMDQISRRARALLATRDVISATKEERVEDLLPSDEAAAVAEAVAKLTSWAGRE